MKKLALLIGFMTLLASGTAFAVPRTMSFTGRLSTSTGPVTGSVNLTFKLYSVATGGTETWTEVRNGVGADNGLVFVDLGEVTPLDPTDFTGPKMYLEIQVGTEVLSPRLAINSVPYTLHSENSDLLGGLVTAADVVTTVTGSNGISAAKSGNTVSVALLTTGCSSGQVYKYNGSTFACANDADSPPVAGAGIAVSGNTVSLSTAGCTAAGYIWKWNGSAWGCAPDANNVYTGTGGITVNAANQISITTAGCSIGYVWKYTSTGFACSPDADTTYTASSTSGIDITGTALSVDPTDFNAIPQNVGGASGSLNTIDSTGELITQVAITAPMAGNVVVFAGGDAYCSTCAAGTNEWTGGYFTISTVNSGTVASGDYQYQVFRGPPTGQTLNEYHTVNVQNIFPVAAGTTTFYFRGGVTDIAETVTVFRARMTAFFVPN